MITKLNIGELWRKHQDLTFSEIRSVADAAEAAADSRAWQIRRSQNTRNLNQNASNSKERGAK